MSHPSDPLFELRDVSIETGGSVLLDRITLSVARGEHVAILGPNGSGKSSLVRTLTSEHYPSLRDGATPVMRILGTERWDVDVLRRAFGIVLPDHLNGAPRSLTVADVVLSGFFGSVGLWPHHVVTGQMHATVRTTLTRLGALRLASRPIATLSAGETRRVLIARALVHEPCALLLDEPGTSLDVAGLAELRSAMREVAASGTTLILVTHQLGDIVPEIQRIVLLKRGRILADGPRHAVLTGPMLSALYDCPIDVTQRGGYDYLIH
jgi:iron complex transport system ATP-binding protein